MRKLRRKLNGNMLSFGGGDRGKGVVYEAPL